MTKSLTSFVLFSVLMTAALCSAQIDDLPIADGKFKPTDESLKQYQYPDWFRDAKFGIWSCWGPQTVPGWSDWGAKNMYVQGTHDYQFLLKQYGHPSEFGYKDIIPLWKAEKWNPEEQMKLFKRAGAKYFAAIAVFHDNFSLWDTKLNRWNSVNMGPKKDIVGIWQKAAKQEGLYFGVTEHLGASYTWFQKAHGSDKTGPKAGVPYDGNNPDYWDLYHEPTQPGDKDWYTNNPKFQRDWYDRIKELIDNYHPDLLYSDGELPFGNVGRGLLAHYYNAALQYNKDGVVYNCKHPSEGKWVRDFEQGVASEIFAEPWQIDTSLSTWFYQPRDSKSAADIIRLLIDTVSKNGNLLLDVPQKPDGSLDEKLIPVLEKIGKWMDVNGEAIYGTRPWQVFGEGPSMTEKQEKTRHAHGTGSIKDYRQYKPGDLRFTQKNNTVYVFSMEKPNGDITVKSLAGQKITSVKLLGSDETIEWSQNADAVIIKLPKTLPNAKPAVFAVSTKS